LMREKPERRHTTETLAGTAALSPYHFNRVFHNTIGLPPVEYLRAVRIDNAKRLLLTTPLTVTEICFEVGYTSLGSFVTRFTQLVGLSPTELRRAAATFELDCVRRFCELHQEPLSRKRASAPIFGRISTRSALDGVIFVGLFQSPVPLSSPLRCFVLTEPGAFQFEEVPDGTYFVAAAMMPWSNLLAPDVCRGMSEPVTINDRRAQRDVTLELRPPSLYDPPILAALPLILVRAHAGTPGQAFSVG
jgi:AraC family transcriptional regulator